MTSKSLHLASHAFTAFTHKIIHTHYILLTSNKISAIYTATHLCACQHALQNQHCSCTSQLSLENDNLCQHSHTSSTRQWSSRRRRGGEGGGGVERRGKPNKMGNDTTTLLHHPYIVCHFANSAHHKTHYMTIRQLTYAMLISLQHICLILHSCSCTKTPY